MNKIEVKNFNFFYGNFQALIGLNLPVRQNQITALIGPSGCGKSTFLRSLNRMNDTISIARAEGEVLLDGKNVYDPDVDVVIAVGDVTDLCLFSLALHLQTRNLARGLGQRIVVPESCVQTWDAPGHPGDLYHVLFLHQLARNGVEVVASIEP